MAIWRREFDGSPRSVVEHAPRDPDRCPTYIAKSALIQTACDGRSFGGRIVIADSVIISDGVIVTTYGGSIEIGADTYIGPYCVLYGMAASLSPQNHDRGAHGDHPGQSRL